MRGAIPPLSQYAFMAYLVLKKRHRETYMYIPEYKFEKI
jgi:hypothetical protein